MSAHAQPRLSDEEYLALERKAELRNEFFDGTIQLRQGLRDFTGLDAICRFDSVDCSIPLAEIYDKITFEETSPL